MVHVLTFSVRRVKFWVLEVLVLLNLASRLKNVPQRKTGQSAQMKNGYKLPFLYNPDRPRLRMLVWWRKLMIVSLQNSPKILSENY